MITKILNFLFGAKAKIFNSQGQVQHQLPKGYWKSWEDRYKNHPDYNWKNHSGTKVQSEFITYSKKKLH